MGGFVAPHKMPLKTWDKDGIFSGSFTDIVAFISKCLSPEKQQFETKNILRLFDSALISHFLRIKQKIFFENLCII